MKLYGLFSITPNFGNASYMTHVTDAVIHYKTRYGISVFIRIYTIVYS